MNKLDVKRLPQMALVCLIGAFACLFFASWLAVDLRHAAKITLAVGAFVCGVTFICLLAALNDER